MICVEISLRGCSQGDGPSGDGPLPFFLGQEVLGTGLGAAGQNSPVVHTCGVWPHWHPAMWAESLGMCVRQRRKSSAHLLFWCLFCIYPWVGVSASGPEVHRVCHLNPGGLALLPSMEEFRKRTPEKYMFPILRKRKRKGLQEQWKCYAKDLPILYLCHL